jgi:hypothetical protein
VLVIRGKGIDVVVRSYGTAYGAFGYRTCPTQDADILTK